MNIPVCNNNFPTPKPGKDPAEPNNYRPIALRSCLCKILERIINKKLTWIIESNRILRFQSGLELTAV